MNDQSPKSIDQVRTELLELGRSLREAAHLDPRTQQELARLLEEFGTELDSAAIPSTHTAHLAEAVERVARTLHEQQHSGVIAAAHERLLQAAKTAETEAPVFAGIVRRMIDVLASVGI